MVDTEIPYLISNQKCAMSRSGGVCLSADFEIIVCRWVRIMWKKTCFLVRGGEYAFEKLAKLHCVPRLTHGSSTLTTHSTLWTAASGVAYVAFGGPLDNISFGAPVCSARRSYHHGSHHRPACSWCARNARLGMASVITMFMIQTKIIPREGHLCIDCLFLDAISALPHLPSPEMKVRLGFSCDMIFTQKFFGLHDTPVAHSFCITGGRRTANSFD